MREDARAWSTAGRANVILDNLLAAGAAEPMIDAMPLGYGLPDASSLATTTPRALGRQWGEGEDLPVLQAFVARVKLQCWSLPILPNIQALFSQMLAYCLGL